MGQEARNTGNTATPADLRVLRAGGEHKSPLPKDFVAEVERRARAEGKHEPEQGDAGGADRPDLKKPILVGGGILAALVLAAVLIFADGSGSNDGTGNSVVASGTDDDAMAVAAGDAAATRDGESGADASDAATAGSPDATGSAQTIAGIDGVSSDFGSPSVSASEPVALEMADGELAYHQPADEAVLAVFESEGNIDMPLPDQVESDGLLYWSEVKPATLDVHQISATTGGGVLQNGVPTALTGDPAVPAAESSGQILASGDELVATKPATVAAPPKGTRIQLAAYGSEQRANEAWSELQTTHGDLLAGLQPMVESALLDSGTFYRLQAGPFGSTDDAAAFCQQLVERQLDCIVIPR